MIKFLKYPSITNTYNTKSLVDFLRVVPEKTVWSISEKIHGANFSFKSTRKIVGTPLNLSVFKRTGGTDTNFFKLKHSEDFIDVHQKIHDFMMVLYYRDPSIRSIEVDGEVFGGNIQKGVFYSNSKRFAAFDIRINEEFISYVDFDNLCQEFNIYKAPALFVGTLEECMNYPNEFNSVVPIELGYDYPEENICEGVVIRPLKEYKLSSGARVILKNKNKKWSEKASRPKGKKELSEVDLKEFQRLQTFINKNRIESAISKIGAEMQFIPELLREVQRDIGEEAETTIFSSRESHTNYLRKNLNTTIVLLIKESIKERVL